MSKTENDFEDSLEYWRDLAKMLREELKKEQASRELKLPSEKQLQKHSGMWAIAKQRDSAVEDFEMGAYWMLENICYLNQINKVIVALNECEGEGK